MNGAAGLTAPFRHVARIKISVKAVVRKPFALAGSACQIRTFLDPLDPKRRP
jgi:hypothetical protein